MCTDLLPGYMYTFFLVFYELVGMCSSHGFSLVKLLVKPLVKQLRKNQDYT